jgi:hypothetical protein
MAIPGTIPAVPVISTNVWPGTVFVLTAIVVEVSPTDPLTDVPAGIAADPEIGAPGSGAVPEKDSLFDPSGVSNLV